MTTEEDPDRTTGFVYDVLNRQIQVIYPASIAGQARRATVSTEFDPLGRQTGQTNEAQVVTRYNYSAALGVLLAVTNAFGLADKGWAS